MSDANDFKEQNEIDVETKLTAEEFFSLPRTVVQSEEYRQLEEEEFRLGPDGLLEVILDKKVWSNEEIAWIIRRLIFNYGGKDPLMRKIPIERLFVNIGDMLRSFYVLFDRENPALDDNTRAYICAKLADSTWGITSKTRVYLEKLP